MTHSCELLPMCPDRTPRITSNHRFQPTVSLRGAASSRTSRCTTHDSGRRLKRGVRRHQRGKVEASC